MRYPASEKLEIIRLVEQSHLPARERWKSSVFPDLTDWGLCNIKSRAPRRKETAHRNVLLWEKLTEGSFPWLRTSMAFHSGGPLRYGCQPDISSGPALTDLG
jgi:hypothetical protein